MKGLRRVGDRLGISKMFLNINAASLLATNSSYFAKPLMEIQFIRVTIDYLLKPHVRIRCCKD